MIACCVGQSVSVSTANRRRRQIERFAVCGYADSRHYGHFECGAALRESYAVEVKEPYGALRLLRAVGLATVILWLLHFWTFCYEVDGVFALESFY